MTADDSMRADGNARISPTMVIGVGNRDRGDDGVGPLAVDALRERLGPLANTFVAEGDLSDLAIRWSRDQAVVIVDGMSSGRAPGSIVETDAITNRLTTEETLLSSHGVGLAEAVELARLLDRLPKRLTVIGVEIGQFGQFDDVSPAVRKAIPIVVDRVRALLED